jgi:hypothetical protein
MSHARPAFALPSARKCCTKKKTQTPNSYVSSTKADGNFPGNSTWCVIALQGGTCFLALQETPADESESRGTPPTCWTA